MKNFKKIMALVVAMVMVIATMNLTAMADQGAATADGSISISGLDDSDTVKLYKVIGWTDSVGWAFVNNFSDPQIAPHLGTTNTPFSINQDIVNNLSSQITNSTPTTAGTLSDGTFEATVDPGMYIAIVTAGTAGTIYNPIIVSSDFVTGGNTIDASDAGSVIPSSTGGTAVAKKSTITLEKEGTDTTTVDTNDKETVAVGDTVNFDIDTQIPPFATYINPIFTITDELSDGITLGTVDTIVVTEPASAVRDQDYTVTRNSDHKFTIEFTKEYLKKVAANTAVHIDYPATITSNAVKSINPENNTVTLEYQRNPQSDSDDDTTKVRDITNHYSFSIDGKLLGNDSYSATEVVKVGVSADGSEITETIQLANGNSVGALQGAKFKLVYDNNGAAGTTTVPKFKRDANGAAVQDGVWEDIESDAQGRLSITGLDAGVYWLVETDAPDGYIKMQDAVKVEIQAHEKEVSYTDEDGCVINTTELDWYKIFIGGTETAYYEIHNSKVAANATSEIGDSVVGTDANKGKLKNTKGVELPSTGGMGTTLFYAIGAILVLGAGILLVSKRRMSAN